MSPISAASCEPRGPLIHGAITAARRFPPVPAGECGLCGPGASRPSRRSAGGGDPPAAAHRGPRIPLFLAVDLWVERGRRGRWSARPFWAVGALGLAAFFMLWGGWSETVRGGPLSADGRGTAPARGGGRRSWPREPRGILEYNKRLFFR